MIRRVDDPEGGGRVETGALQIGNDWPGVFIRGDEAIGLVTLIEVAQHSGFLPRSGLLAQLVETLRSCEVKPNAD